MHRQLCTRTQASLTKSVRVSQVPKIWLKTEYYIQYPQPCSNEQDPERIASMRNDKTDCMKKLSIIIAILFVLLLSFYGRFNGDKLSRANDNQATQHQAQPEPFINQLDSKQPLSDIAADKSSNETPPGQESAHQGKMAYDSDWCMAATDLNEQGIAYYQQELEDWDLSRGRISPPLPDGYVPDRSQYLLPYIESSHDELWKQIKAGNEYAMIAALSRFDFSVESQRRIAQRLLVKGDLSPKFKTMTLMRFPINWSQWRSQNEKTLHRRTNHQSHQAA